MVRSHVHIYCDVTPRIGYGHLRRSLSLYKSLLRNNHSVSISYLNKASVNFFPTEFLSRTDNSNLVVIDSPFDISKCIEQARIQDLTTVTLDWFGNIEPDYAINVFNHKECKAKKEVFVGIKYFMIRDEITTLPKKIRGKDVVISMGGNDLNGYGPIIAENLSTNQLHPLLINGPLAKHCKEIKRYRSISNPDNYEELILDSSWMVTNGGTCMFEGMCIGKGVLSIPQTKAENTLAHYLYDQGGLLGVGMRCLRSYTKDEIRKASDIAVNLVDGLGLKRVTSIISSLL